MTLPCIFHTCLILSWPLFSFKQVPPTIPHHPPPSQHTHTEKQIRRMLWIWSDEKNRFTKLRQMFLHTCLKWFLSGSCALEEYDGVYAGSEHHQEGSWTGSDSSEPTIKSQTWNEWRDAAEKNSLELFFSCLWPKLLFLFPFPVEVGWLFSWTINWADYNQNNTWKMNN